MSDGIATNSYMWFDPLGRITWTNVQIGANNYPFTYTYNLAGALTSETYPSGRVVNTTYDIAGRATQLTGTYSGQQTNYVSNVAYAPQGAPTQYAYANNLQRQATYNTRLQLTGFTDTNSSTASQLLNVSLNWGGTNNNGNLQSANYNGFSEIYGYDTLNRLISASDSSGSWSRAFQYDQWGNMWVDPANSGGVPLAGNTPTSDIYNPAKNQMNAKPTMPPETCSR